MPAATQISVLVGACAKTCWRLPAATAHELPLPEPPGLTRIMVWASAKTEQQQIAQRKKKENVDRMAPPEYGKFACLFTLAISNAGQARGVYEVGREGIGGGRLYSLLRIG